MPAALTWDQIQARKDKGVRFLRNVVQDDDLADDLEDESLKDYAGRKGFAIANPLRTPQGDMQMPQMNGKKRVMIGSGVRRGGVFATQNPTAPNPPQDSVSKADLFRRINDLEDENSQYQDRFDQIADLASAPKDEDSQTDDDRVDILNKILDIAAPDDIEDNDGDQDDEDDDQD